MDDDKSPRLDLGRLKAVESEIKREIKLNMKRHDLSKAESRHEDVMTR